MWAHKETTDKITLLDVIPIAVSVNEAISPVTVQPVRLLGTYLSEAKARTVGKLWVYGQLMGLGIDIDLPLPTQDGSECTEPAWRKSGWRRTADGSWGYSISDFSSRNRALIAYVTESVMDDFDAEEEYQDSDDKAEDQKFVLVGPAGSRKRVFEGQI